MDNAISKKRWRVALYLRLSKEDRRKGSDISDSIINQESMLREYIVRHSDEMELVDIFKDDGATGGNFQREGFQAMMRHVENGDINLVLVKSLSRFGRNDTEFGHYINWFQEHGVRLIAVNNGVDTLDHSSNQHLFLNIQNIIDANYLLANSEAVKSSLHQLQAEGKCIAAIPRYGFVKDPTDRHKLAIDPNSAEIVKYIFQRFLTGQSINEITRDLNKRNIPNPSAYKHSIGIKTNRGSSDAWVSSTVRRILADPVYCGDLVQHKTEKKNHRTNKQTAVPLEEQKVFRNAHPAIISRKDFETAQQLLDKRTRVSPVSHDLSLFAGLLYCGDCGHALRKKDINKYQYYKCYTGKTNPGECTNHTIRADYLEKVVLQIIQMLVNFTVDVDAILDDTKKLPRPTGTTTGQGLQRAQQALERKRISLRRMYEDSVTGTLDADLFQSLKETTQAEIAQLSASIKELEQLSAEEEMQQTKEPDFITSLKANRNITTLSRELLVTLIDRILVYENQEIEIRFKFSDAYLEALSKAQGSMLSA